MSSRHCLRAVGGLLLFACLPLTTGCGPNYKARATVNGTVTISGKKLTTGTVMFLTKDNVSGSATIGTDGTYAMNDAPVGDVKVTVTVSKPPPMGMGHLKGAPVGPTMPGDTTPASAGKVPSTIVPIPEKYASVETSGLTYKVERGTHTYDIPLTP